MPQWKHGSFGAKLLPRLLYPMWQVVPVLMRQRWTTLEHYSSKTALCWKPCWQYFVHAIDSMPAEHADEKLVEKRADVYIEHSSLSCF
mmetsp:Transcript_138430/g.275953  ORF Transcript_138430/g.275953 Transcript_138430/m.275953 type:complete len:88 (-) Transcript_138430:36-299(-)